MLQQILDTAVWAFVGWEAVAGVGHHASRRRLQGRTFTALGTPCDIVIVVTASGPIGNQLGGLEVASEISASVLQPPRNKKLKLYHEDQMKKNRILKFSHWLTKPQVSSS